jgi:hypothetical protein
MELRGSCHCGAVRFRLDSATPYPYMACYCSNCLPGEDTEPGGSRGKGQLSQEALLQSLR